MTMTQTEGQTPPYLDDDDGDEITSLASQQTKSQQQSSLWSCPLCGHSLSWMHWSGLELEELLKIMACAQKSLQIPSPSSEQCWPTGERRFAS